jgi:hypothetical protein
MDDKTAQLDKRLALVEQKLDLILTNHLAHMQDSIEGIQRTFKWAIGIVFVQLIGVIVALALML